VTKWKNQKHPPAALHDEDYAAVKKAQKSVFEELMESVFNDPAFEHVTGATLYEMYKLVIKRDSPSTRAIKGKGTFLQDVERWVEREAPTVTHKTINIFKSGGVGGKTQKTSGKVFCSDESAAKKSVPDNSHKYITVSEYGVQLLVERGSPIEDDRPEEMFE
jgi:hypothetical protein